jgi:hypothetical protein
MDKTTDEIKICITQQQIFILLNLEIDCQLVVMFNLEGDRIMYPVLKALEEAIHLLKTHLVVFNKLRYKHNNKMQKEEHIMERCIKNKLKKVY